MGAFLAWSLLPPAPLALPPRGAELRDVTVVEPGLARRPHQRIRIEEGSIASVEAEADGADGTAPFAGRFVLPGLIDMHVHFPPPTGLGQTELFAFLFLYHGVTTVRDAGDVDGTASAPARDGVRDGAFPGPRSFACGPFLDGSAPLWPNSVAVRDAAEAEVAVRRIAADGFDCVKVYDGLSPEALAGARAEAARHGLRVIGHVPRAVSYLDARIEDVQHLTGIGREAGDRRPFPQAVDGLARLPDAELAALARRTAELGIAHTPTLVVVERLHGTRDLDASRSAPGARLLPRLYRDAVWVPGATRPPFSPDDYAVLASLVEGGRRVVRALHAAGVQLHAGSDVLNPFVTPGESLHRELELLVRAGLSPEQAWVAATRAPGAFLGVPGLGTLAPGAPADLLVFREDPTRDLGALATLEAVIADGRFYPRAALDAQLARTLRHAEGFVFDRLSVAVTRRFLARLRDEGAASGDGAASGS